jgi:hypothetical protein
MDRRHFLTTSVPAVAALSLGLGGCNDSGSDTPPPFGGAETFPDISFITRDGNFEDYRPAIDATSARVVFERTPHPNPGKAETQLYVISPIDGPNPTVTPLVPPTIAPPAIYPLAQTRPDWNWLSGAVVFTGAASQASQTHAYIVSSDGSTLSVVPLTANHIYPNWSTNGQRIVLFNNSSSASPVRPVTVLIDLDGKAIESNLNGTDASTPPVPMFGGFASPRPGFPQQIAFAGQPALTTWGLAPGAVPPMTAEYNQDNNYVFLNRAVGAGYLSSPLEPAASVQVFDRAYQGRAPYWSPDGRHIVFESSRAKGYALFLANVALGTPPVQLTDIHYWAQHAKFFPDGTRLVFSALQTPNSTGTGPRGICVIDISAYLT